MVKGPLKVFRDNIHNENVYFLLSVGLQQSSDGISSVVWLCLWYRGPRRKITLKIEPMYVKVKLETSFWLKLQEAIQMPSITLSFNQGFKFR